MEAENKVENLNGSTNECKDENDESIVTMLDVLEQENEEEADANAVLGGVDDKTCTYSQGYLPRQPLFACKTCYKEKPAGVCLACSYSCHEGHQLVELYTKRNFRCDCGTPSFPEVKCNLEIIKEEANENNTYNQNFEGVYCTCCRPYPDPEDHEDDIMAQCIVCEDWYHGRHLTCNEPKLEEEAEMICQICMEKLPFLNRYVGFEKPEGNADECQFSKISADPEKVVPANAIFWPAGWRKNLCSCSSCRALFEQKKVSFLFDENDSTVVYERENKKNPRETQYERGMRALSNLDHVQQVEAIQGYNDMKSALMEHLQKFRDSNKVVCESDIREFFDQMKAKRRRVMVAPTCR